MQELPNPLHVSTDSTQNHTTVKNVCKSMSDNDPGHDVELHLGDDSNIDETILLILSIPFVGFLFFMT